MFLCFFVGLAIGLLTAILLYKNQNTVIQPLTRSKVNLNDYPDSLESLQCIKKIGKQSLVQYYECNHKILEISEKLGI